MTLIIRKALFVKHRQNITPQHLQEPDVCRHEYTLNLEHEKSEGNFGKWGAFLITGSWDGIQAMKLACIASSSTLGATSSAHIKIFSQFNI